MVSKYLITFRRVGMFQKQRVDHRDFRTVPWSPNYLNYFYRFVILPLCSQHLPKVRAPVLLYQRRRWYCQIKTSWTRSTHIIFISLLDFLIQVRRYNKVVSRRKVIFSWEKWTNSNVENQEGYNALLPKGLRDSLVLLAFKY